MAESQARHYRLRGRVQGVGFRPYVWRLAQELGLTGWVLNDAVGVQAQVEGTAAALAAFARRLPTEIPALARIDDLAERPVPPAGFGDFIIRPSLAGTPDTAIGPDAAPCPACLAEMSDPANRRWRHAFISCTACGPRYTVSHGLPYDRARTSLAEFPLCPACAAEYGNPADRRFHAETTACPACGPQLQLLDSAGQPLPGDPLAGALAYLRAGAIVALKGVGGFHLACRADRPASVAELRRRKQRDSKPLAVMALNLASWRPLAEIDDAAGRLLSSPAAPIVLLPLRPASAWPAHLAGLPASVAPSRLDDPAAPPLAWLGAMLPGSPLHFLLWHEAAGRPAGPAWLAEASDLLLVMTSANPGGEPLVSDNAEALHRLAGLADAFLLHDRAIVARCDDSVLRADGTPLRRARGLVPDSLPLAEDGPSVLAVGGYLKNSLALLHGRHATLSPHVGSLDNAATRAAQASTLARLLDLVALAPDAVAHDLHPDCPAAHLAVSHAGATGRPALAVGHHHAHIAAVLAEHGQCGPALGLALDGSGHGPDGTLWGGELLRVHGADCRRLGHLAPLPLPGGDLAARQPWRMAVAALHGLGRAGEAPALLARHHPGCEAGPLLAMLDRQLNCPPTSSLGRLFDAAAGLLGVATRNGHEAQAALALESLAWRHGPAEPLADGYRLQAGVLDFAPLLGWLADGPPPGPAAAVFHATLAAGLADWVAAADEPTLAVAWGGGCSLNQVLGPALAARLAARGRTFLQARQAPPNDGGLALGQAWIVRHRLLESARCV